MGKALAPSPSDGTSSTCRGAINGGVCFGIAEAHRTPPTSEKLVGVIGGGGKRPRASFRRERPRATYQNARARSVQLRAH